MGERQRALEDLVTGNPDFLIIGGGVVGITLALETRRRHPGARVVLLEKEPSCGRHASGRNSGVVHAGFYYTSDSLKARLTREGNRRLTEYCRERDLPINACGKLVVALEPNDWSGLDELIRRARANGVELHEVTEAEAREIEPRARTCERALFSPTTASVSPGSVMAALVEDARCHDVEILTGTAYLGRAGTDVRTSAGRISPGYVINAAGLYADRVARDFGFAEDYRILPFKGLYLHASSDCGFRTHVYPVPDLEYPFLGVHFTLTVEGDVKIGPTAIPALWREHYSGVRNFRLKEMTEIGRLEGGLFVRNDFDFRRLARRELRKHSKRRLLTLAQELLSGELPKRRWRWGRAGIRAQLLDIRRRRLEMDFRFQGDDRSFHVLNAVSPAFTCAIPLAEYLLDRIEELASGTADSRRATAPVRRTGTAGAAAL